MFKTRETALAMLIACCSAFPSGARAATIEFQFDSSLQTGALAGTQFTGLASYDNSGITGIGTEYLTLTSFNFTLLGTTFTQADISQGGQAILQNGTLSYFTAALFPADPPAPVNDIAFGFGGPGVIGYSTPPGLTLARAPTPFKSFPFRNLRLSPCCWGQSSSFLYGTSERGVPPRRAETTASHQCLHVILPGCCLGDVSLGVYDSAHVRHPFYSSPSD